MIPILLISDNKKEMADYLEKIKDKNNLFIEILPQKTEYSIDQIREIQKETKVFNPQKRIYLLENFQKSSLEAQNAFLKLLEEPPKNVQFILTVNSQYKLLPTILSRAKIISLTKNKAMMVEAKLSKIFDLSSRKTSTLPLMIEVKSREETRDVLWQMLTFFREKLAGDINASSILKEVLKNLNLLENNNLNPQLTIDHLLIFIYKKYKMK